MQPTFVRLGAYLGAAVMLSLAACGPSDLVGKDKLGKVKDGATLAEVASAIGEGPLKPLQPGDSARLFHGYRNQQFLAKGQTYRIIWVRDEPGSIEDQVVREKESPIVMVGDSVIGTGWSFFDDTAESIGLPNPYRAKDRLDSMSRAGMKK